MNTRTQKQKPTTQKAKGQLHPRNQHQGRYDLEALMTVSPELVPFVGPNKQGELSVDFHHSLAVVALNKALLISHYGVGFWHLPEHYLCPPIPGRVDYVHYLADLLAEDQAQGLPPKGEGVRILDVGVGASAIYPLLGQAEYGWQFVGSDIDPVSVANVKSIVAGNPHLHGQIDVRLQRSAEHILTGILTTEDSFLASMCNPPFHVSAAAAAEGSRRKVQNLKGKPIGKVKLNFGGQHNELWCPGGEVAFIGKMIQESQDYAESCLWFTSLVSKKESLSPLYQQLREVGAVKVKTIAMQQGQKNSRLLAWTFSTKAQRVQRMAQLKG